MVPGMLRNPKNIKNPIKYTVGPIYRHFWAVMVGVWDQDRNLKCLKNQKKSLIL